MIDLINGLLLKFLVIDLPISVGQLVRGIFLAFLLSSFLLDRNRSVIDSYLRILLIYFYLFLLFIWIFSDFMLNVLFDELVIILRLLLFYFLIRYTMIHSRYVSNKMNSIIITNSIIFSFSIILSYLTGVGLEGYEKYYESSKGFFYGNNPVGLLGLIFLIYLTFYNSSKNKTRNNFMIFIVFLSLYISGSKTFLVFIVILVFFALYKLLTQINMKLFLVIAFSFLSIVVLIYENKSIKESFWTNRYEKRIVSSYLQFQKQNITMPILFDAYAYISPSRAVDAYEAMKYLNKHLEKVVFGTGHYFKTYKLWGYKNSIESDLFDTIVTFGIVGFLIILFPLVYIITRTQGPGKFRILIIIILLYGIVAGHVLYNPMASGMLALFCGVNYYDGRLQSKRY